MLNEGVPNEIEITNILSLAREILSKEVVYKTADVMYTGYLVDVVESFLNNVFRTKIEVPDRDKEHFALCFESLKNLVCQFSNGGCADRIEALCGKFFDFMKKLQKGERDVLSRFNEMQREVISVRYRYTMGEIGYAYTKKYIEYCNDSIGEVYKQLLELRTEYMHKRRLFLVAKGLLDDDE